jgi:hypothetical protein
MNGHEVLLNTLLTTSKHWQCWVPRLASSVHVAAAPHFRRYSLSSRHLPIGQSHQPSTLQAAAHSNGDWCHSQSQGSPSVVGVPSHLSAPLVVPPSSARAISPENHITYAVIATGCRRVLVRRPGPLGGQWG